jgi:predicted DNA-binding protein (UPF0251 family)
MPRRYRRRVGARLHDRYFKPAGVPIRHLDEVLISKEDLETLRLRYVKGLNQNEASDSMGISQSQYQRDITDVLKSITDALVSGKAIRITSTN